MTSPKDQYGRDLLDSNAKPSAMEKWTPDERARKFPKQRSLEEDLREAANRLVIRNCYSIELYKEEVARIGEIYKIPTNYIMERLDDVLTMIGREAKAVKLIHE